MDTATTGRSLASILGAFALALTPPSNAEETVYYVHVDALGSPILETDQAGNVVRQLDYRAYGEEVLDSPKDGPAFTGHYRDAATGLVYMQQRYYDPAAGRFLSVDPAGVNSTTGENFNRYWYADNNPYKFIDPDGRAAICAIPGPMQVCVAAAVKAAQAIGAAGTVAKATLPGIIAGIVGIVALNETGSADNGEHGATTPDIPGDLVGVQDEKSGRRGGTHVSGPLAPEHGGAGDAEKDFEKLGGGNSRPTPPSRGAPVGTRIAPNNVQIRPAKDEKGPRIDIPAKGDKPAETLHYLPRDREQ